MVSHHVLVVGSVAYDTIITSTKTHERVLGGSATYAALAANLFTPVRLVAVVGNDFQHAQLLYEKGIDLEGLQIDRTRPSFYWKGEYSPDFSSRRTLETHLNAFEHFSPDLPTKYRDSSFVLLGNIHPQLQLHVLSQLTSKPFVVTDTMDLWIRTAQTDLDEVLKKTHLLVINNSESLLMTKEKNIFKAGKQILKMGPKFVIIKLGEFGSVLFSKDKRFVLPAFPVEEVFDPTGAGDTYAGTLIGYLESLNKTDFCSIKQAMVYATIAAGLTVQDISCNQLLEATADQIMELSSSFLKMITIA